jgi:FKBP-type peptidyl-prolyl cis-trans isomerase SlyD
MKPLLVVLFLALVFNLSPNIARGEEDAVVIQDGSLVSFDYTLTVDGKVVDSTEGKEPLQYTQGKGELIPGLSKQLEGMRVGDEKKIVVPPEEAYGEVDPNAFKEVARSSLPKGIEPQVDMLLQANSPDGRTFPVRIAEVKEDTVVLDFNHPLAGKTLYFQVKIVSIQ